MPKTTVELQRQYQREWVAKRRREYLADKCCVRCGSTENLEVDHIDPKKKTTHRIWSLSRKRREQELAKCQVLCRSCHQRKTIAELDVRGEARSNARLTDAKVRRARRLRLQGWSFGDLAHKFQVGESTIRHAVSGTTWNHVRGAVKVSRGQ